MRVRSFASPIVLLSLLSLAPVASAQTKEEKKEEATATPKKEEGAAAGKKDEDVEGPVTKAHVGPVEDEKLSPSDPKEEAGKTYYFIGARARFTMLPKFMLGLFVAGGPSQVWIPSFGLEGTMRKDGFDTTLYLTYADWSMKPFPFKGKDEAATAWEIVESKLKLINLGVDLLWGTDFSKAVSFQYGITAGLAAVIGDLKRVQGYSTQNADENPDNIKPCNGVGNPSPAYCGNDNDHYGDYKEPSWFNGGKKPNIYASFGPQLGFRFKPVKQFMGRINFGWDLFAGPFFGFNGSYGL